MWQQQQAWASSIKHSGEEVAVTSPATRTATVSATAAGLTKQVVATATSAAVLAEIHHSSECGSSSERGLAASSTAAGSMPVTIAAT